MYRIRVGNINFRFTILDSIYKYVIMKNILLISFLMLWLWGCKDDNEGLFGGSVSLEQISFKPVEGGAIMYYDLKGHNDIFSIRARYTDVQGKKVTVDGTYLSDSLNLVGFNEARQGVPVWVSFFNNKLEESAALDLSFDTKDSAPYAFFNDVEVLPGWSGFTVIYNTSVSTGYAHVFLVAQNQELGVVDTLLVQTVLLRAGRDTLSFDLGDKGSTSNTVMIATEDFRGYRVKQKIWDNVESYEIEQFPSGKIKLLDPCNILVNNSTQVVKPEYLFDGDKNGVNRLSLTKPATQYSTFVAGPGAVGKYWVLDLGEERIIGKLRMFAPYRYGTMSGWIWKASHINKLPCEVTIYGSNDRSSWDRLGYFYESPLVAGWGETAYENVVELGALKEKAEVYKDISCIASQQGYRYIKFLVGDTFYDKRGLTTSKDNPEGYVTLSELEVYVKKE